MLPTNLLETDERAGEGAFVRDRVAGERNAIRAIR